MKTSPSPVAAASPFTAEQEAELRRWTEKYPYKNMGLVEALRSVQDWQRCVTPEAAARVAELFGMPFNHVWGVATFFPTFTREKTGRHRVGLCHGLSCWMAGSNKAAKRLEEAFGVPERACTPDGAVSWEEVECQGACEQGPALQVNDRLRGKATEELISQLKRELK